MAYYNRKRHLTLANGSWKQYAACHGRTRLFFSKKPSDIAAAETICSKCMVQRKCEELFQSQPLDIRREGGVWGGVSRLEKRAR